MGLCPAPRLSQCLPTLPRFWRSRSDLGAFALPPEIILMVTAYLPNVSVISLALTCRSLYRLCFPRNLHLDRVELKKLLLLLEKDVSSVYFCERCVGLHRWRAKWANSGWPWIAGHLPCQRPAQSNVLNIPFTVYMPYRVARLVMNRHFYGPAHGISLRQLECRTRRRFPTRRVLDPESTQARIVDDKLLLLSTKTLSHPGGDPHKLRSYVDSRGSGVCRHLTLSRGRPASAPMQIPELAQDKNTTGRHFAACDQSFGSCTFCLTDYCIDISWRNKKKGYIIKVSVYRELGACRSPYDWNWQSMTSIQMLRELRTAYPQERKPGIVRDRWNKACGIDSRTESEWIEIPGLVSRS